MRMEVYNKVMIELEGLKKDCVSPKYLIPDYSNFPTYLEDRVHYKNSSRKTIDFKYCQKNTVKLLEGVRKERASKINFISGSRNLDIILNILLLLID